MPNKDLLKLFILELKINVPRKRGDGILYHKLGTKDGWCHGVDKGSQFHGRAVLKHFYMRAAQIGRGKIGTHQRNGQVFFFLQVQAHRGFIFNPFV